MPDLQDIPFSEVNFVGPTAMNPDYLPIVFYNFSGWILFIYEKNQIWFLKIYKNKNLYNVLKEAIEQRLFSLIIVTGTFYFVKGTFADAGPGNTETTHSRRHCFV